MRIASWVDGSGRKNTLLSLLRNSSAEPCWRAAAVRWVGGKPPAFTLAGS
jgi:hypothetical protein